MMNRTQHLQTLMGRTLSTLAMAALLGVWSATAGAAGDIASQTISKPFAKVVTRMRKEIAGHKLVIVKEVPYQKMLKMVGTKSEPIMGFEVFHPRYGKVLYKADVTSFKEVPLRILVRGAGGEKVIVEYRKPSAVLAAYPGLSSLGKELDAAFADIVKRAGK